MNSVGFALSITTLSADAAGATVSVSLGPLPCTHTSPIVSLSPSQSAAAGGALTYNVSVTNTDGSACTASAFNVTAAVPSGWPGPIASPVLTIAPGASASTTLRVTSPVTAPVGSYPVPATATSSADSTKSATASSAYVVTSPLTAQVSMDLVQLRFGAVVSRRYRSAATRRWPPRRSARRSADRYGSPERLALHPVALERRAVQRPGRWQRSARCGVSSEHGAASARSTVPRQRRAPCSEAPSTLSRSAQHAAKRPARWGEAPSTLERQQPERCRVKCRARCSDSP